MTETLRHDHEAPPSLDPRWLDYRDEFWTRVDVRSPDECWEWRGGRSGGYGKVTYRGLHQRAHRLAYHYAVGDIASPRLCVCHSCDNRLCCNPRHFFLGTRAQNQADMANKGRASKPPQFGEENGHAKLTEASVLEARSSTLPSSVLARRFGVAAQTVDRARRRISWRHLP